MRIIIDDREPKLFQLCQDLLVQTDEKTKNIITLVTQVLHLGDIVLETDDQKTIMLIERKSFADLLASIKDGRYEEQSYRLINSSGLHPHSVLYLLEGMFSQLKRPQTEKPIILSAITSLNVFKGFSTHRTATIQETAEWVIALAKKMDKELKKGKRPYYSVEEAQNQLSGSLDTAPSKSIMNEKGDELKGDELKSDELKGDELTITCNPTTSLSNTNTNTISESTYCTVVKKVKKDNITPTNIGEIILCQIPGISSQTAMAIMAHFPSGFPDLIKQIQADPARLDNILIPPTNGAQKGRKINKNSIENIKRFLIGE
jgi:ERCC4-type nuclease